MKRMIRSMADFLFAVVLVYAALVALLYVFQRKLMYVPDTNVSSPAEYGLQGFADERAGAADGISIQLWYREAGQGFPTIVYYHGNASHLGNRAGIFAALAARGFGVLGVSYRGYGRSEGSPDEQGLYADARAAIGFLAQRGIPVERLVLYGESLGTGVAIQMATEYDVGMLALQAPYMSVAGRAAEIYYYVPVRFLIDDRYDSIDKIGRVKAPLLLFHGELDTVIPAAHGRAIFEKAAPPKQAFFLPQVSHNDFDSDFIAEQMLLFAKRHGMIH